MLFVIYPSHLNLYGISPSDQIQWVARTARENDLPVIDLSIPLAATGEEMEQLYLLPIDGHPSPRGYRVASEYIADMIQRNPRIPNGCD